MQAARKWGISVVNYTWLEDFFAVWHLPPMNDTKYTTLLLPRVPVGHLGEDSNARPPPPEQQRTMTAIRSPQQQAAKRRQLSVSLSPRNFVKQRQHVEDSACAMQESESFKSVSTVTKDNSQQIRSASAAFRKGVGLPRLRSTEELQ